MASIYNVPTFGLAIDWETSGYTAPPGDYAAKHQGISFGAIIFDVKTLESVDAIYHEIQFDEKKYLWESGAERVHGLSRDHLKKNGVKAEVAAADLANLVLKYIGTDDVLLLGHRVYFDRSFTVQLMNTVNIQLSYHPTTIDSSSMATILLETSKSEEVFTTLGLPPRAAHNAMEDIIYTLASVKRMKEIFLQGVVTEL